jgi:hypothetical protein
MLHALLFRCGLLSEIPTLHKSSYMCREMKVEHIAKFDHMEWYSVYLDKAQIRWSFSWSGILSSTGSVLKNSELCS